MARLQLFPQSSPILFSATFLLMIPASTVANYGAYSHFTEQEHNENYQRALKELNNYQSQVNEGLQNIRDDVVNGYNHLQKNLAMEYPTGPPSLASNTGYQNPQNNQHQSQYDAAPSPTPSAASCLSRIRLAASFDPTISSKINRFIDSMRIDRLRAYVCERTAYFCDENQQREVGDLFHQYEKSIEIIDQVRHQLTTTEKDQLNMMENLNDTLAEQAFFVYKFHQLNPVDLAVLTSAKASLTTALTANSPDASLSKAMGSFSPQDMERISSLPVAHLPEEVRSHLARCQITAPEVIQDTVAFLLSVIGSKQNNYR